MCGPPRHSAGEPVLLTHVGHMHGHRTAAAPETVGAPSRVAHGTSRTHSAHLRPPLGCPLQSQAPRVAPAFRVTKHNAMCPPAPLACKALPSTVHQTVSGPRTSIGCRRGPLAVPSKARCLPQLTSGDSSAAAPALDIHAHSTQAEGQAVQAHSHGSWLHTGSSLEDTGQASGAQHTRE